MKKLRILFISCVLVQGLCAASIYGMDIFEATVEGNNDRMLELIASGEDVNQQNGGGTPLHYAALIGRQAVAKTLIAFGANVNQKDNNTGWTPLHESALTGRQEVAQILIANGANVNQQDNTGWTPLHEATLNGRQVIIDLINRVNAAPEIAKSQLLALLCAGHPRLGSLSPAQAVFQNAHSETARIIAPFIRRAALEDALYQQ